MNSILPSFGKDVSIDIGTSMTRVMGGTRETMMSEPSIVATDTKLDKIVAVGDDADRIVRRMPDMWMELTPLQDGRRLPRNAYDVKIFSSQGIQYIA